jgi:hypothetical protein
MMHLKVWVCGSLSSDGHEYDEELNASKSIYNECHVYTIRAELLSTVATPRGADSTASY